MARLTAPALRQIAALFAKFTHIPNLRKNMFYGDQGQRFLLGSRPFAGVHIRRDYRPSNLFPGTHGADREHPRSQ